MDRLEDNTGKTSMLQTDLLIHLNPIKILYSFVEINNMHIKNSQNNLEQILNKIKDLLYHISRLITDL